MTIEQIKKAIEAGKCVKWKNSRYNVVCDKFDRLLVKDMHNGYCNNLLDSDLDDCFI